VDTHAAELLENFEFLGDAVRSDVEAEVAEGKHLAGRSLKDEGESFGNGVLDVEEFRGEILG
jgi:hypothetical protein